MIFVSKKNRQALPGRPGRPKKNDRQAGRPKKDDRQTGRQKKIFGRPQVGF